MLIDRFRLPADFEVVEDEFDRRAHRLLTLMRPRSATATGLVVERIVRTVMDLARRDRFINTDKEETPELPPASEGEAPTGGSSSSPSKSPRSETEPATSATSNATQA
jgi:hypothetical protein